MLTRNDARMIAEELFKLMTKGDDVFLSKEEAAAFINVKPSFFDHHPNLFDRRKTVRAYSYSKKSLAEWMKR